MLRPGSTSPNATITAGGTASHTYSPSWNKFKSDVPNAADDDSSYGAVTPTLGRITPSNPSSPGNNNIQGGLGTLNRWSQSTTSSKSSIIFAGHQRNISSTSTFDAAIISPPNNGPVFQGQHGFQHQMTHDQAGASLLGSLEVDAPTVPDATNAAWQQPDLTPTNHELKSSDLFKDPWSHTRNPGFKAADDLGPLLAESQDTIVSEGETSIFDDLNTSLADGKKNDKRRKGHSQKAMLSKALQKANTAVLLDNAANFEGAMEAYNDACRLLQLVMLRSNGGEDEKLKLQEIRDTYMIRVTELERMDFSGGAESKALPQRPISQEYYGDALQPSLDDYHPKSLSDDATFTQSAAVPSQQLPEEPRELTQSHIPPKRQTPPLSTYEEGDQRHTDPSMVTKQSDASSQFNIPLDKPWNGQRTSSDAVDSHVEVETGKRNIYDPRYSDLSLLSTHSRDLYESTSWLDTIDESGASSPASLHSKASSVYLRHRGSRRLSRGTEAEFDAALDAAVEAAYDEGLEPAMELRNGNDDDVVANARRNVELAKQKVREAEQEAVVAMSRGWEARRVEQMAHDHSSAMNSDYHDDEAEEEERLLEEMTNGYVMDDFEFDLHSKSALPRQSDSSSFSGRTWESSVASNITTGGAALSPLAEDDVASLAGEKQEPNTLTSDKSATEASALTNPSQGLTSSPSVRARRMSGQTTTELKIETNARSKDMVASRPNQSPEHWASRPPPPLPKDEPTHPTSTSRALGLSSSGQWPAHSSKRNASIGSLSENFNGGGSGSTAIPEDDSRIPSPSRSIDKVPSMPDHLGIPSLGPKSFRERNPSLAGPDSAVYSPETPSSQAFPTLDLQKGTVGASELILPAAGATAVPNGLSSGGMYLFDSHIHSPTSPGTPNPMASNAPLPLEPCPESFLLRPFWLMRCIYQTIAHPRGGYLSTKLFVPRDVWRVKNVKIKAVDEKVSNCDLLTAALLKLAKVDTYDADAVLDEMQSLENVLEQVQASLTKKIGSEVGVQGAMPLFRNPQSPDDTMHVDTLPTKTSSVPSKSYLTSWRKLRSKNSGIGSAPPLTGTKETNKDHLTISSLPMTSLPNSQPVRRDTTQLQLNGPNTNYMGALARLCDAAQVLDQIAQQVEDPGLKHSSETLVGLELSTRHAAEFFGFFVCRFALNDISMMLDKFIKRGSEWVLI
ncbi:uncharacterized protein BDW47DRAFT_114623 [Aspergillus candidus]|uniref:MIT domain-containing protein n=1 Tax=Aspergillus candidus TaxID=41067 RepID=A0A2I2FP40_ASPCN|nr:hypothetical protein BDW47DRAFT_114623 [Aspergillus candidus]PLB42397.1 hypothetical protein BDW47DRAFT_114623 [Aspergillus candidus]